MAAGKDRALGTCTHTNVASLYHGSRRPQRTQDKPLSSLCECMRDLPQANCPPEHTGYRNTQQREAMGLPKSISSPLHSCQMLPSRSTTTRRQRGRGQRRMPGFPLRGEVLPPRRSGPTILATQCTHSRLGRWDDHSFPSSHTTPSLRGVHISTGKPPPPLLGN